MSFKLKGIRRLFEPNHRLRFYSNYVVIYLRKLVTRCTKRNRNLIFKLMTSVFTSKCLFVRGEDHVDKSQRKRERDRRVLIFR